MVLVWRKPPATTEAAVDQDVFSKKKIKDALRPHLEK